MKSIKSILSQDIPDEELMILCLSDVMPRKAIYQPGFISNTIAELKEYVRKGGNYFEFFFDLHQRWFQPVNYIDGRLTRNQSYQHPTPRNLPDEQLMFNRNNWRMHKARKIAVEKGISIDAAINELRITDEQKIELRIAKEKEQSNKMNRQLKKHQAYTQFEEMVNNGQFKPTTGCVLFDLDTMEYNEFPDHIEAADSINVTLSNIYNCATTKSLMKKKYGVVYIKEPKKYTKKQNPSDE